MVRDVSVLDLTTHGCRIHHGQWRLDGGNTTHPGPPTSTHGHGGSDAISGSLAVRAAYSHAVHAMLQYDTQSPRYAMAYTIRDATIHTCYATMPINSIHVTTNIVLYFVNSVVL